MSNYSAGTLELSVLGISESAVQSIDRTVRSLRSLSNAIRAINNSQVTHAATAMRIFFDKMSEATQKIDPTAAKTIASIGSSISAITKVKYLNDINWDKIGDGFSQLAVKITPFIDKAKEAETSLVALHGVLSKMGNKRMQNFLMNSGTGGGKDSLFSAAKLGATYIIAKRLGRVMADIVQSGSDYTETLNLWQVAMRNNLDMAGDFVESMNKAYGISTKTLMNAQAIFRNMIGTLGNIGEEAAYQISEALVQMSADFSSLYNVKIEKAFEKMQAMLAGQVRPIRSAGLDMTEVTLYQLYQSIGGTKSMRQLTRTEKQLLSILAVYNQMGAAGALGDMTKTLNQFANQTRMMTEYWEELKVWTGLVLKDLIDESHILIYTNALLITATNIMKAIAQSKGLGQENFIDGMFETTEQVNEEIDELQGKLLDFDKFRSLSGNEQNVLGIDERLLEAISGYSSHISQAKNEANELAEIWTEFFVVNGKITDTAEVLLEVLEAVGAVIAGIVGYNLINGITNISTGLTKINGTAVMLSAGLGMLVYGITQFIEVSEHMSSLEKVTTILLSLTAAVIGFYVALNSLKMGVPAALAAGAALAGGTLAIAAMLKQMSIPNYATGASDIDSGTIFRAGEFGKTEAVYTGSNGKTNVANVKQMEQAFYNAIKRYGSEGSNGDDRVVVVIGEDEVFSAVRRRANRQGLDFTKR